jgi:hypothetical protein
MTPPCQTLELGGQNNWKEVVSVCSDKRERR